MIPHLIDPNWKRIFLAIVAAILVVAALYWLTGCTSGGRIEAGGGVEADQSQSVARVSVGELMAALTAKIEAVVNAALTAYFKLNVDTKLNALVGLTNKVESYTSGIKTKMENTQQAVISGRDVVNNSVDRWLMYGLLSLVGVLALTYPVGKLIWILTQKSGRKVATVAKAFKR